MQFEYGFNGLKLDVEASFEGKHIPASGTFRETTCEQACYPTCEELQVTCGECEFDVSEVYELMRRNDLIVVGDKIVDKETEEPVLFESQFVRKPHGVFQLISLDFLIKEHAEQLNAQSGHEG